MEQTINYITLLVGITSIVLAIIAIWLVIAFKKQSDDINRDTAEKLARIEAFATMTKKDAFDEIKKWGDFARTRGKAVEEVEKAKEKELKKLKEDLRTETSEQINKALQIVEGTFAHVKESSATLEIRKEFQELKEGIEQIQEKGLNEISNLNAKDRFKRLWLTLPTIQRDLVRNLNMDPLLTPERLHKAGLLSLYDIKLFVEKLLNYGVTWVVKKYGDIPFRVTLRPEFQEFLKTVEKDEMD